MVKVLVLGTSDCGFESRSPYNSLLKNRDTSEDDILVLL